MCGCQWTTVWPVCGIEASQIEYFPLCRLLWAAALRPGRRQIVGGVVPRVGQCVFACDRICCTVWDESTYSAINSERLYIEHNILSFTFLTKDRLKDVVLSVSIVPGLEINKTRRLVRHVPTSERNIVVVDHHTGACVSVRPQQARGGTFSAASSGSLPSCHGCVAMDVLCGVALCFLLHLLMTASRWTVRGLITYRAAMVRLSRRRGIGLHPVLDRF